MKKIITLISFLISLQLTSQIYSQSGWNSIFFNNTNTFSKIVRVDSLNYFAFCTYSQYYFRSSDGGNNWISNKSLSFDSVYSIYDGQFINSNTGWIVGENSQYYNGVIMMSTNGGLNWTKQNTGFSPNFENLCLYFLNINTGWIGSSGGTNGRLYKTTNGGLNWTFQEFPGSYNVNSIRFTDYNNGWISGFNGLLSKTTDGGLTWTSKTINNIPCSHSYYVDVFPLNAQECWALVTCTPNYTLVYSNYFKTIDGGNNWNLMFSYTDSLQTNSKSFSDVYFINSSTGFSNGDFGFIFRTTNSGINWNRINIANVYGAYPVINTLLPLNNSDIITGGGWSHVGSGLPYNYIYKSTNLGLNWNLKTYNWEYLFHNLFFWDNDNGLVTADTGIIFRTTNHGNNWIKIFDNRNYYLRIITFINSTTGFAMGAGTSYYYYGKILRTSTAGNNWVEIPCPSLRGINTATFSNQNTGWAGCDGGYFLKSTNSGLIWDSISLPLSYKFNYTDICFINDQTGWIIGNFFHPSPPSGGYYETIILKTINSGQNWSLIFDTSSNNTYYTKFKFFNNNSGILFTNQKFKKTTNGGSNWFDLSSNFNLSPTDFYMLNENTGWVCGYDGIIKTTDGGFNWLFQFNEHGKAYSLFALDENHAWFCGDYSSVYSTTNGGGVIGINPIYKSFPTQFLLSQNYPNPFNPVTKIKFELPKTSFTKLIIYDILGKQVGIIINEQLKSGVYDFDWDGSSFASGIYFYSLQTEDFTETKKMVLIK